nr:1086_t:CDS:2 [Entrophospora candida]
MLFGSNDGMIQYFVPNNHNNYDNQAAGYHYNNYYIHQNSGDNNYIHQNPGDNIHIQQNPEENNFSHQNNQNFVENNYIDQNSGDGFAGVVGGAGSNITTSINYLNNCFDNSFIGQNVHQNNDQLPLLIYIVFQLRNIQHFLYNNNNNRY